MIPLCRPSLWTTEEHFQSSTNPRGTYRWKLRTRRGAVALPTPPCHPPRTYTAPLPVRITPCWPTTGPSVPWKRTASQGATTREDATCTTASRASEPPARPSVATPLSKCPSRTDDPGSFDGAGHVLPPTTRRSPPSRRGLCSIRFRTTGMTKKGPANEREPCGDAATRCDEH